MSGQLEFRNPYKLSSFFKPEDKRFPSPFIREADINLDFEPVMDIIIRCYQTEASQEYLRHPRDFEKMVAYYEKNRQNIIQDLIGNKLLVAESPTGEIIGSGLLKLEIDEEIIELLYNKKKEDSLVSTVYGYKMSNKLRQFGVWFTDPDYNRQGIGTSILLRAKDEVLKYDEKGIILFSSWKDGQRFFEKHFPGSNIGRIDTAYGPPGEVHFLDLTNRRILQSFDDIGNSLA